MDRPEALISLKFPTGECMSGHLIGVQPAKQATLVLTSAMVRISQRSAAHNNRASAVLFQGLQSPKFFDHQLASRQPLMHLLNIS